MSAFGSKTSQFHRGVIESAGLMEVSHFLRKANQQVEYAKYSLEHTDFSETYKRVEAIKGKVSSINKAIAELNDDLAFVEVVLAGEIEEQDESKKEKARIDELQEKRRPRKEFRDNRLHQR